MRNFIAITIILTSAFFCKGQSLNLVPVDSANFAIIADSLVDGYSIIPSPILPDSIKFNPEIIKICPCVIDSLNGLISYKSSSIFIKSNKCLFLYKTGLEYYIRVGQMTNVKNEYGKFIWKFSTNKMRKETADKYITITENEISKAEVPRYEGFVSVCDGVSYTFGDLTKSEFATTPIPYYYSDSIIELIELSNKLIKRNR